MILGSNFETWDYFVSPCVRVYHYWAPGYQLPTTNWRTIMRSVSDRVSACIYPIVEMSHVERVVSTPPCILFLMKFLNFAYGQLLRWPIFGFAPISGWPFTLACYMLPIACELSLLTCCAAAPSCRGFGFWVRACSDLDLDSGDIWVGWWWGRERERVIETCEWGRNYGVTMGMGIGYMSAYSNGYAVLYFCLNRIRELAGLSVEYRALSIA